MKIISWNVNGIRAVEKKGFVNWLLNCGADIVCIQETKASPDKLSQELLNPGAQNSLQNDLPDYEDDEPLFAQIIKQNAENWQHAEDSQLAENSKQNAIYNSYFQSAKKAGYSGSAIYSQIPCTKTENLGVQEFDDEGRCTICYFEKNQKNKLAVISAYFPNSQDKGKRLDYKLRFCKAIYEKCNELVKSGYNIVLCGDYNIAHTPDDIANPKQNEGNAGYLPEERQWMDFFLANGYTDTFRLFCKEGGHYSWWSYRTNARERNIGWRIDYLCVNNNFVPKVKSSTILTEIFGSDHCPVMLELEF